MDWPTPVIAPLSSIFLWSQEMLGTYLLTMLSSTSSANELSGQTNTAYPAASRIQYIPFGIATPVTISQLWCYNGAFTGTPNINMGIYTPDGTLIVQSGSTPQATSNAIQIFDITDTILGAGDYYLAIIASATTANLFMISIANQFFGRAMGCLQEAGATAVLPATATFASFTGTTVPEIGFSTSRMSVLSVWGWQGINSDFARQKQPQHSVDLTMIQGV